MALFSTALAWTLDNWEDPTHEYKIEPDAPPGAFAIAGVNSVENAVAYHLIAAAEQDERAPLVSHFYQNAFWNQWLEQLTSDELAKRVFDAAVNMGSFAAVQCLQRALRLSADGLWGPITLDAANSAMPSYAVLSFKQERASYYDSIVAAKPQDEKYRDNWRKRALK